MLTQSFKTLKSLESVDRFSGDAISQPESVLAHSGWVALWSLFIAQDLQQAVPTYVPDYAALLPRALLHDLDEVGTGDIPRLTKYAHPELKTELDKFALQSVGQTRRDLGLVSERLETWYDTAKSWQGSVEQYIVLLADYAAVLYRVWDEVMLRNNFAFVNVAYEFVQNLEELPFIVGREYDSERVYFNKLVSEMELMAGDIIRHYEFNTDLINKNFLPYKHEDTT